MLSNADLLSELAALSAEAAALAKRVRGDGGLAPRQLAGALVEADKLQARLAKLGKTLSASNGKKR